MPTKSVQFAMCHFPPETLREALDHLDRVGKTWLAEHFPPPDGEQRLPDSEQCTWTPESLSVRVGTTTWNFDALEEFFADLRRPHDSAYASFSGMGGTASLQEQPGRTDVTVKAETRAMVESIIAPFERDAEKYTVLPDLGSAPRPAPTIFIGHGRSAAWRELSDFLHHQMGYEVEAFETLPRAGHDIVTVLTEMLAKTNVGLLVMTAEDEQPDGQVRARQNVIHEIGLWQGRIGWNRTLVLLEEGVEDFSNIAGVQQLRFPPGRISSMYGDIVATLRREFGV